MKTKERLPGKRTVNISNAARLWTPPQGHETEIPQVLHTSPASCLGRRTHCLPGALAEATSAVFYRQEDEYFWRKEFMIPRVPKPWVQNVPREENSTSWKCNRMTLFHKPQLFWLLYRDDKEMCWSQATLLQGTWRTVGNGSSYTPVSINPTQLGDNKLQSSSLNSSDLPVLCFARSHVLKFSDRSSPFLGRCVTPSHSCCVLEPPQQGRSSYVGIQKIGVSLVLQGFDNGKWQQISLHAVMQAEMLVLRFLPPSTYTGKKQIRWTGTSIMFLTAWEGSVPNSSNFDQACLYSSIKRLIML